MGWNPVACCLTNLFSRETSQKAEFSEAAHERLREPIILALKQRTQHLQELVDRSREALIVLQSSYYEDRRRIAKLEQELNWAYSTISSLIPDNSESSSSAFPGVPVHTVDRRKDFFDAKSSPSNEKRNLNLHKKRLMGRRDANTVDGTRISSELL